MSVQRRDVGLYWDQAWKLSDGCTKVSPGCDNCWSETETAMRYHHPNLAIQARSSGVLARCHVNDGTVAVGDDLRFDGRILLREDNLLLPLRVKRPTVFAVWNDLYHEDVPDDFRDRAYAVMALCSQHVFLVLTKRASRLADYWAAPRVDLGMRIWKASPVTNKFTRLPATRCGLFQTDGIPNVWHGVTVENQAMADQRIPALLQVPGHRFLSLEPLLELVKLSGLDDRYGRLGVYRPWLAFESRPCMIHAVLVGGESGKHARPMHPDWARSLCDECGAARVPFFFKQWGEWEELTSENRDQTKRVCLVDLDGRVKEWSGSPSNDDQASMIRRGRKKTGRHLDGRTHDDLPWSCR